MIQTLPYSNGSAFLSTPSGWRATYEVLCKLAAFLFLSTPSGWRATHAKALRQDGHGISIHALRVEGDNKDLIRTKLEQIISIHALRVEGDNAQKTPILILADISIHALRVEGDNFVDLRRFLADISIHALRVEGDFGGFSSCFAKINRHSPYLSITLHKCYPYYLFGISTFPSSVYHSIALRKFSITIV